jgi:cytochrome c oxidase subunit II
MLAPEKIWWKPMGRMEKTWLTVAFVWCVFLTLMMPLWYFLGKQNVPTETYRVTREQFAAQVNEFVTAYQIGEENGIPVVAPPPGSDMPTCAPAHGSGIPFCNWKRERPTACTSLRWTLQHGFSLQPVNINLQIIPGYDYVATIVPTSTGEFTIVCNEFCNLGHHTMVGKVIVK